MATTYTLISSNTLTSSAASVTFSSIPNTFTDLVLKWSIRDTNSSTVGNLFVVLNSDTTNNSYTRITGQGSTASSSNATATAGLFAGQNDGDLSTTNTFSNGEMYIPNYTGITNKPTSAFNVSETNDATNNRIIALAGLNTGTSAVTSLTLNASVSFVANSSFYLYGIKSS